MYDPRCNPNHQLILARPFADRDRVTYPSGRLEATSGQWAERLTPATGPSQNNAAAAEVGPAEGNSLLPGCLRGGTLKQWKFPSSKGEQKKRCWKLLLRRDSFFQGLTEEKRFPQLTETHSVLQDVIPREALIKNYSLTEPYSFPVFPCVSTQLLPRDLSGQGWPWAQHSPPHQSWAPDTRSQDLDSAPIPIFLHGSGIL